MFDSAGKQTRGRKSVTQGHKVQKGTLIPTSAEFQGTHVAEPGSKDQNLSAVKLFLKTGALKTW